MIKGRIGLVDPESNQVLMNPFVKSLMKIE